MGVSFHLKPSGPERLQIQQLKTRSGFIPRTSHRMLHEKVGPLKIDREVLSLGDAGFLQLLFLLGFFFKSDYGKPAKIHPAFSFKVDDAKPQGCPWNSLIASFLEVGLQVWSSVSSNLEPFFPQSWKLENGCISKITSFHPGVIFYDYGRKMEKAGRGRWWFQQSFEIPHRENLAEVMQCNLTVAYDFSDGLVKKHQLILFSWRWMEW